MGSGYLMLYGGIDGNETTRIGVATSDDGISWQKDPEPVLAADSCGKPGAQYAAGPRLIPTDDGYLLLFDQDRETAMATSTDGHAWTCAGPIRCWSPRMYLADRESTPSRPLTSTVGQRAHRVADRRRLRDLARGAADSLTSPELDPSTAVRHSSGQMRQ